MDITTTSSLEAEASMIKTKRKKRGRRSKKSESRNVRRLVEDKLDEMKLQRFMADYCFDD